MPPAMEAAIKTKIINFPIAFEMSSVFKGASLYISINKSAVVIGERR